MLRVGGLARLALAAVSRAVRLARSVVGRAAAAALRIASLEPPRGEHEPRALFRVEASGERVRILPTSRRGALSWAARLAFPWRAERARREASAEERRILSSLPPALYVAHFDGPSHARQGSRALVLRDCSRIAEGGRCAVAGALGAVDITPAVSGLAFQDHDSLSARELSAIAGVPGAAVPDDDPRSSLFLRAPRTLRPARSAPRPRVPPLHPLPPAPGLRGGRGV